MLKPGKQYTREQIQKAVTLGEAERLKLTGYVLRHDVLSDKYSIVHWTHAGSGAEFGQLRQQPRRAVDPNAFNLDDIAPIRRRTPDERVDSMMQRLVEHHRATGTVPGLGDPEIMAVLGMTKGTKREGVTAEDIQRIVAHMLQKAENIKNRDDFSKIVVPSANDIK